MKAAVIGAGFAGCEAAWQLNKAGIAVDLYEMKPQHFSPAHKSDKFAELVCSNSFKAQRLNSAAGLLKTEMLEFGSVCVNAALKTAVPAGGALAVDREQFSALVTQEIEDHPLITVIREELDALPLFGSTDYEAAYQYRDKVLAKDTSLDRAIVIMPLMAVPISPFSAVIGVYLSAITAKRFGYGAA